MGRTSDKALGVFAHAERQKPTGRGFVVRDLVSGFPVDQYNYGGLAPVATFSTRGHKAAERLAATLTRQYPEKENPSRNPDLFDGIRVGDRVTIVNRFGQERAGRATIHNRQQDLWVLNMGGPHGTPGIATRENVTRVSTGKKNPATPKARRFVARKIRKLAHEGAPPRRRVAEALAVARRKGFRSVPRRPATGRRTNPVLGVIANESPAVFTVSNRVKEIVYVHAQDGREWVHPFAPGVSATFLQDGRCVLWRRDGKPVGGRRIGNAIRPIGG